MTATLVITLITLPISIGNTIMLLFGLGAIYLAHMFYCAECDLMNPQIELYATVGSSESNPNETRATVSAFIISFAVTAAMLLLLIEGTGFNPYAKLILASLAALGYRAYMFFTKIKLYYKEK
jgi:hypothetical protein